MEQIKSLEEIIFQLRNVDAKLDAGRIIRAYRENGKMLAFFETVKREIINQAKNRNLKESKDKESKDSNILEQVQEIEDVIRQLHKINSLIYAGQIVAASGCNNKLSYSLKRKQCQINDKDKIC